jgi:hypothetical protein
MGSNPLGLASRQQLKENGPQGINVRRSGYRQAPDLLGAGVLRGEWAHRGRSGGESGIMAGIQQLGHSEIKEFGNSLCGNKNIAGLKVAMDYQPTVGIRDGLANSQEQP